MRDLQQAIDQARKLHETLCYVKGARMSGGDPEPIEADALARLVDLANAMEHFCDPMDAAAKVAVEGTRIAAQ
jgi:hypothetical protein